MSVENRLIACPCLIVMTVVATIFEAAGGIQVDVDTGLPGAPVCSSWEVLVTRSS